MSERPEKTEQAANGRRGPRAKVWAVVALIVLVLLVAAGVYQWHQAHTYPGLILPLRCCATPNATVFPTSTP